MGVPLFVRGRQIRPTEFLPAALRHARRVVMESHLLQSELEAIQHGMAGRVRIGAMVVANADILPKVLGLLRREQQPPLQFSVLEDSAANLWQQFDRDELDLFVGRLDEKAYRGDVLSEVLFHDEHRVVIGPTHPLAKQEGVTWADLVDAPWVLPPPGTPLRRAVDGTFLNLGLRTPVPWLETTALGLLQELLQDAASVGVLSHAAAQRSQRLQLLASLPLRLVSDIGPIGMVWRKGEASPGMLLVLEALRRTARYVAEPS